MAQLEQKAQGTLELATKITTFGILILNEEDKSDVDNKIKQLKEYAATMTAKTHVQFNRYVWTLLLNSCTCTLNTYPRKRVKRDGQKSGIIFNVFICFSRLLDDYLVLFMKEVDDRKDWISVNENKMSSSYLEIEDLSGFENELDEHKVIERLRLRCSLPLLLGGR